MSVERKDVRTILSLHPYSDLLGQLRKPLALDDAVMYGQSLPPLQRFSTDRKGGSSTEDRLQWTLRAIHKSDSEALRKIAITNGTGTKVTLRSRVLSPWSQRQWPPLRCPGQKSRALTRPHKDTSHRHPLPWVVICYSSSGVELKKLMWPEKMPSSSFCRWRQRPLWESSKAVLVSVLFLLLFCLPGKCKVMQKHHPIGKWQRDPSCSEPRLSLMETC